MFMKRFLSILSIFVSILFSQTSNDFAQKLSQKAIELTENFVAYDPTYFKISYPNGDIPANKGVCTDVVIRSYRALGIDLQKEVHEDMRDNFELYPKNWGLKKTDKNIDHRRVLNLMKYFSRYGISKKISQNSDDYVPGDIVAWNLGGSITHIGVVVDKKSADNKRYMVVHNIGAGQVVEDFLFQAKIIGHYSYNNL